MPRYRVVYLSELYLGSLFRSFCRFEISSFLKTEETGKDILGETANGCIEVLGCIVEVGTCYVDTVFRTFQLCLQFQEILICFQVRIVFCDGKQFTEGGSHRTLCFLIFSQLFRSKVCRIHFDLSGFAAGFYYTFQCCLLYTSDAADE